MDTEQFSALLVDQSADFQAAPEFGTDWFPKNEGEYVCVVSKIFKKVVNSKGLVYPLWRINLELLEGEGAGQETVIVITGRDENALGRVKALASTLQGSKFTGDLPTADAVFTRAHEKQQPLLVKYDRKAKTGEGQTGFYDNVNVLKVLAEVTTGTVAEPQTADPSAVTPGEQATPTS